MRILLIRFGLFVPELYAGTELALHWLCRALIANGHELITAANGQDVERGTVTVDHKCGYPVYRSANLNASVHIALQRSCPDVVILPEGGDWLSILMPSVSEFPMVVYEH
jgi:hypothetical protein